MKNFNNGVGQNLKQVLLLQLLSRKTGQIWLFSVFLAMILTELIVAGMGLLLKGEVPPDYLLTGLVASFCVASLIVSILSYLLQQLRDSQLQLQTIIELEPECVELLALDSTVLQMNKAGLAMMEAESLAQLSEHKLQQWVLPEYQASFAALIQNVFAGKSANLQFEIQTLKGSRRWVDAHAVPLRNADGRITALLAVMHDITERKRSEMVLAESENLLRTIIDTVPMRIFWKDINLHFLGCNMAFAKDAGLTHPDELVGKDDYQMVWKQQADLYRADDRAVMESGIPRLSYEEPQTTPVGELIWLRTSKVPLKNSQHQTIGILGMYEDISGSKRIEQSLKESELMLKEAQEIAHLGHWTLDVSSNQLYWSDEIYRIFGAVPQEFKATYEAFLEYIHPEDRSFVDYSYAIHLVSKADYALEHRVLLKDGTVKYVFEKCKTEFDPNNKPLRSIGVVLDISQRKEIERLLQEKTEALLQSNADLEQFAYSVSHDMRQPLRSIVGHLQLLARSLQDKLDDDERSNLNFAMDSTKRMDAMIVSLLDYSRIGRKTETKTWLSSRAVLNEALAFLTQAIKETKAEIITSGDWGQVFGSENELSRLLMNLISNALKYREESHPARVEIDSAMDEKIWRVRIRDFGIGINPQQADRLFKFFSRLQSRTRFEGTGMGLALCKRIVEHHGGKIWLESAGEGQGCCFIFELPVNKQSAQQENESDYN